MDNISFMPSQKISETEKNKDDKEWYKECCNSCISLISTTNNYKRTSRKEKLINYNLYNGRLDKKDLKYILNPFGFTEEDTPAELRHYDKLSPIFNTLIGEESKKPFNFVVRAINEEAVSEREQAVKAKFHEFMQEQLDEYQNEKQGQNPKTDPDLERKFKQFSYEMTYEFQDTRELFATRILNYLRRLLDVERKLLLGYEDALISSEEIYRIDIVSNQPDIRRCNPAELYFMIPHNGMDVDDAEVIIEETWMTNSQIIDAFYEELTEEQIEFLESASGLSSTDGLGYYNQFPLMMNDSVEAVINQEESATDNLFTAVDARGNRRVLRTVWRSKVNVGLKKMPDEEGNEITDYVSRDYKPSPDEEIDWIWINEYRECTRIGTDIYVNMRPCLVQRRSIGNISKCKSPYVGSMYSNGITKAVSLMDRLKAYQYLYDVMFYRTELLIAKSYGKIMEFDLASIPKSMGWDVDKWLYYMTTMGVSFKNSREEDQKGQALGMMAGGQTATREINLEQGQFINQHIMLLNYIDQQIMSLSGVTPQRMGAIGGDELVGNVQRAVNQSAYITEKYTSMHNNVKKRVYEALVEVAKECYRDRQIDIIDVTGDLATKHLKVDGTELENAVYGLFVSNAGADQRVYERLEQMVDLGLNRDKINFSQAMKLLKTESIAEVTKQIEFMENEASANAQSQQQQEMQVQQEQMDYEKQFREREFGLQELKINSDIEAKQRDSILKAEIEMAKIEANVQNGTVELSELDSIKANIEQQKLELEKTKAYKADLISQQQISIEKQRLILEDKKINNDLRKATIMANSRPKTISK